MRRREADASASRVRNVVALRSYPGRAMLRIAAWLRVGGIDATVRPSQQTWRGQSGMSTLTWWVRELNHDSGRVVRRGLVGAPETCECQRVGGATRSLVPRPALEERQPAEIRPGFRSRPTDPGKLERRACVPRTNRTPQSSTLDSTPLVKRVPSTLRQSAVGTHIERLPVRPQLVPIAMPDSVGHRTDHVDPAGTSRAFTTGC